jgi:putative aminopeptidase FrvX
MDTAARDFFQKLLEAPGVSGYEQSVQRVVRDYVKAFADEVTTDVHGNVIAVANPDAELRLMLDGHCDQLGMLVSYIDASGFLYFQTVGGWDPQQLIGQRVSVWAEGGPINGVISRKAIHLLSPEERKVVVDPNDMWIDIGATDKSDAQSVVKIADAVTVQLGFQEMRNGIANAPAMDNRTGVWVVIEALRKAKARGLDCALYAVSAVQEEIGHRGTKTAAFGIDPHVGIAVDVTHATDCPRIDKRQRGDIDLGGGPVIVRGPNINPYVGQRLEDLAAKHDIPHQIVALNRGAPNDANALQVTRAGVATGLVQIPNRYMHSAVETISVADLEHTAELLAEFACDLSAGSAFIP